MTLHRGRIFTPLADPFRAPDLADTWSYVDDGYLAVDDAGRIESTGDWSSLPARFKPEAAGATRWPRTTLITPGFVDTHLHAPQLEMIGSYGGHLLQWLEQYTFPTERKFESDDYAKTIAGALFDELACHGTTTSLIFSSVHEGATDRFFEAAEAKGVRAVIGKTMMDRNAPSYLLESPQESYEASRRLIEKWHGRGMLRYAISPRFAPTSTPALLDTAGRLKQEFPDVYVQTHVSENLSEVDWVADLFPDAGSYVDVYDRAGLLDRRTILAHGVHLTAEELDLLRDRQSRIAHCPNSNLFLGSGLFPMSRMIDAGIVIGLGTDIGAGTTPSMFNAMADAYKIQQVLGISLSPFHLWYLATLGGAHALSLQTETGSLEEGKDGDFLVLDLEASPLLARRSAVAESIQDVLSGLIFMGDERAVRAAYVKGKDVRSGPPGMTR